MVFGAGSPGRALCNGFSCTESVLCVACVSSSRATDKMVVCSGLGEVEDIKIVSMGEAWHRMREESNDGFCCETRYANIA